MSTFFIRRPVLAIVSNAMLILFGIMAWTHLPIREYPKISLPVLSVQAHYPNASAEVVESDVTIPLEVALAGVEGLQSMESKSSYEGSHITLRFRHGASVDRALARTRDALSTAQSGLPKEVGGLMLNQESAHNDSFLYISFSLVDAQADKTVRRAATDLERAHLWEFVKLHVCDRLKNIPDVANATIFGDSFAMKVDLDPRRLCQYGLDPQAIISTLETYKTSLPAGRLYGEVPITLTRKLADADAFSDVVLKHNAGACVKLRDVGKVALGTEANLRVRINGQPGVLLGLTQTEDGNLIRISDEVRTRLAQMRSEFPQNITADIIYDKADFIRASVHSLLRSLLEAVALVVLVTIVFLRQIRPVWIPLAAIPVSLIGILASLPAMDFSINLLTLLALLLAIGIVVDDAIVVLENTQRHLDEGQLPYPAAEQSSRELLTAIIAMTCTLVSAFLPLLFMGGLIGQLFREFAWVLMGAVALSGVVALTLSPMMCARLLRTGSHHSKTWERIQVTYRHLLSRLLGAHSRAWALLVLGILMCLCGTLFWHLKYSMVPREDRGFAFIFSQALPNADLDTFERYLYSAEEKTHKVPEIRDHLLFVNKEFGCVVLNLHPWNQRKRDAYALIRTVEESMQHIPLDTFVGTEESGLPGVSGGEQGIQVFVQTPLEYSAFFPALQALQKRCDDSRKFTNFEHGLKLNTLGYDVQFDLAKLTPLGLELPRLTRAAQVMFDKYDHLSFIRNDCMYPVLISSAFPATALDEVYIPAQDGRQISLGSLGKLEGNAVPQSRLRYNQMRAVSLSMKCAPGVSIDTGLKTLQKLAQEALPADTNIAYGESLQKLKEGRSQGIWMWILAILCTYGLLAMQFESFRDPLLVLCTVPLAATGGALALWLCGDSLNIFSQLGFITLIGLITKHGILLVDFWKKRLAAGDDALHAVLNAATLRLRPILMTTSAMCLGILPLAYGGGAGCEARHSIAYVLLGGLSLGTLITLFLLPMLCYSRARAQK